MARLVRVVVPEMPHHVTQRGNGRQKTFLRETDYAEYVRLMAEWCGKHEVEDHSDPNRSFKTSRKGLGSRSGRGNRFRNHGRKEVGDKYGVPGITKEFK